MAVWKCGPAETTTHGRNVTRFIWQLNQEEKERQGLGRRGGWGRKSNNKNNTLMAALLYSLVEVGSRRSRQ